METVERLRELLLTPEAAAELDAPGRTDAAVLVPLYLDSGDLHAVFTKRRDDLRRHAGEISFPGGRQDYPDEDLRLTALREAEEEIGLPSDAVQLVGALPPTGTFVTSCARIVTSWVSLAPSRRATALMFSLRTASDWVHPRSGPSRTARPIGGSGI